MVTGISDLERPLTAETLHILSLVTVEELLETFVRYATDAKCILYFNGKPWSFNQTATIYQSVSLPVVAVDDTSYDRPVKNTEPCIEWLLVTLLTMWRAIWFPSSSPQKIIS